MRRAFDASSAAIPGRVCLRVCLAGWLAGCLCGLRSSFKKIGISFCSPVNQRNQCHANKIPCSSSPVTFAKSRIIKKYSCPPRRLHPSSLKSTTTKLLNTMAANQQHQQHQHQLSRIRTRTSMELEQPPLIPKQQNTISPTSSPASTHSPRRCPVPSV